MVVDAKNLKGPPKNPESGGRIVTEKMKVKELVPYAVIFPYIRMGRSISGFVVNRTKGKFGPFENQIFIGDYTQSIVMRATTEKVNGVWQGACYPFREGFSTGILNLQFTPEGNLLSGGTNRGWPVRGRKPLPWRESTGRAGCLLKSASFDHSERIFKLYQALDRSSGIDPKHYRLSTFTHIYHGGYGGPEVDQTTPVVKSVTLSENGKSASIEVPGIKPGHAYEFDLGELRDEEKTTLLHRHAYYTVNEIPKGK